jgi:threonine/homoserine/homoserine lactone efflux protein
MVLFLVSAIALLGSPGPGIAALILVGRTAGLSGGLRYYAGLQLGLAAAAALSAAGLYSLLRAYPAAMRGLSVAAAIYLIYLAYKIAASPVGSSIEGRDTRPSWTAGLLLGVANPKAYAAFATLLASHPLSQATAASDLLLKWTLCIAVIVVVDIAWLLVGVSLNLMSIHPTVERILNLSLSAMIVGAAMLTLA